MKLTPLYDMYRAWKRRDEASVWERAGRPVPPPQSVKHKIIREYAVRFSLGTLIETGTYLGETVEVMRREFTCIISIELNSLLAERAKKKFNRYSHITILQGDSGELLGDILKSVTVPCLFWLDSHWSAGITARGGSETPILIELGHIFAHTVADHVMLIDDARHFTGAGDYPTLDELRAFVHNHRPELVVEVADDIIRIHP
jgi:hypothetical protein